MKYNLNRLAPAAPQPSPVLLAAAAEGEGEGEGERGWRQGRGTMEGMVTKVPESS